MVLPAQVFLRKIPQIPYPGRIRLSAIKIKIFLLERDEIL